MFDLSPCKSESELISRCQNIEGLSFAQLAHILHWVIPEHTLQRKGWVGAALEKILGSTAGNQAQPDFLHLGIELKTLPLNVQNKPAESTFVTSIPLLTIHQETWDTSQCFAKLRRVLWVLIEADPSIPFAHRRIGYAKLWSPSALERAVLEQDWLELTSFLTQGRLHEINARMGQYLQIRPKAAHARSLCYGLNEQGQKILTLPRGFYLRSTFTASSILS